MSDANEMFISDLVCNVDLFMHGYCGYWLHGAGKIKGKGWLAVDTLDAFNGDRLPTDAETRAVVKLAVKGEPLPKGWFLMDRATGEKVLAAGQKKYGEDFADDYDGCSADVAVQLALLGEVRYG